MVEQIREYDGGRKLIVKSPGFKAIVVVPSMSPNIEVGDKISYSGEYSSPVLNTDLPLEYDGKEDAYNRYITLRCFSPPDSIKITDVSHNFYYKLHHFREKEINYLYNSGVNGETAAFLSAILFGDNSDISVDDRQKFSEVGLSHIIALSGMHVAIIAMILAIAFFPLTLAGYRKLRWLITIIALWIFAIMTGLSPSVVRSVIMTSIVLFSLLLDRPRSSLNSLCLAAFLILLFDPRVLYGVGFQLSFLATLSIILFSNRLNPFGIRNKKLSWLLSPVIVTFAATLGTLALVAYYFHSIPLYSLISNIPCVIISPVMIGGGFLIILISSLGFASPGWLASLMDWTYGKLSALIDFFCGLPLASIDKIYFSAWFLLPVYISIALFFCYVVLRKKAYIYLSVFLLFATISSIILIKPDYSDSELYITRETHHTNIIIRQGDEAVVYSSIGAEKVPFELQRLREKYRHWIATRNIKRFEIIPLEEDVYDLSAGEFTIRIINSNRLPDSINDSEYILITSKYKGNIEEISAVGKTVLLPKEINKLRRQRYEKELQKMDINAIDLSKSAFYLHF